jgi:hypothetical protein
MTFSNILLARVGDSVPRTQMRPARGINLAKGEEYLAFLEPLTGDDGLHIVGSPLGRDCKTSEDVLVWLAAENRAVLNSMPPRRCKPARISGENRGVVSLSHRGAML